MLVRLFTPLSEAENTPMKALLFLLLTISSYSFAQGFRMTGNFTLFADTFNPIRSTYTIMWNENNSSIEGRFSDNVLAANAGVTGTIINGVRSFNIILPTPETRHGVKSLVIESSDFKGMTANIPSTVIAKDLKGVPINRAVAFVQINEDNLAAVQAQEVSNCSTGFGALTGFCGIYSGNLVEEADTGNNCQLTGARLELATNGDLTFFFQYNGSLKDIPRHNFGSLLGTPLSQDINTRIRQCGPLPATQMNSAGCHSLSLVGSFQDYGTIKNFSGTYDIRDEVTGNTCRYSFNLGREVVY